MKEANSVCRFPEFNLQNTIFGSALLECINDGSASVAAKEQQMCKNYLVDSKTGFSFLKEFSREFFFMFLKLHTTQVYTP